MKQLITRLSFAFIVFLSFTVYGQEVIEIQNKFYTSYFSTTAHIPIAVTYTLTKSMVSCPDVVDRKNNFKADPNHKEETSLAKDYKRSGYDRGHNMPAADNKCDSMGMVECFYYSNMTPQPHDFNNGKWKELEELERTYAIDRKKIIVTVGYVGEATTIGVDDVMVPKNMWKVIYTPETERYECYYFPNTDNVEKPLVNYKVKLQVIKDRAEVDFNKGVVSINSEE